MPSRYPDRRAAGQALAAALAVSPRPLETVVLALPRGGVPVAAEVARVLRLPLDVFVVRKLGVPRHEELAFGAIASGGVRVLNADIVRELALPLEIIEEVTRQEAIELERRERLYRQQRPQLDLQGRPVILVDDGLATGATMRAAAAAVRARGAQRVTVAVPVASDSSAENFGREMDDFVCPLRPAHFESVGQWYLDFSQTTDEEVRALLEQGPEFGVR